MSWIRRTVLAATVALGVPFGAAQAEPMVESIHFLIPGGAGGGWDGTARGTGEALVRSGLLGGASYENMSGGGGGKAIAHLIETADRQHDTLMVNSTPIIIRSLRGNFPQSFRDLTPIAGTIGDYAAMVVRPDSPFETWDDVVATFEEDPRSVKIAGGSVRGGMDHLVAALAFAGTGADPLSVAYVPYDAGGDARAGLLSGETDVLSTGLGEVLEQHKAGDLRILAISAEERLDTLPDVPTLEELGSDVTFVNWRGFFGAPGLPEELADRYAAMLEAMYDTEAWEEVRARNGWVEIFTPREEFTAFLEQQEAEVADMFERLGVETVR
mgnify:CR=1 FL=1